MDKIPLNPLYYQYLRRVERACQYIWASARGSEAEPTVYGDAVQHAKEVLSSFSIGDNPMSGTGASMYEDELERLTMAGQLLGILVSEFVEPFTGYKQVTNPDTLAEMAVELWGTDDDA